MWAGMVELALPFLTAGTGLTGQKMAGKQATGRLPCFWCRGDESRLPLSCLCVSLCE
jgi:hypothetical protein